VLALALVLAAPKVHALEPLSAQELVSARDLFRRHANLGNRLRFPSLYVDEPSKAELGTGSVPRRAFASAYDPQTNRTWEGVVDLGTRRVIRWTPRTGVQPLILQEDYVLADKLLRGSSDWRRAIAKRGIRKPDDVHLEPWAPGFVEDAGGSRVMRVLSFLRAESNNAYGRPIEGVLGLVDLTRKRVIRVDDSGVRPLPPQSGDIQVPGASLKPIGTAQPKGASFKVSGHAVAWGPWRFRYALHPREGLVLHLVEVKDGARWRKVLHRASLSEMSVPYGDPDPQWRWRAAFDVGEYGLGLLSTSFEKGLDAPAHALLRDEVLPGDDGTPRILPRAVAMYERDGGVLYRHWDFVTGKTISTRAREFVISFVAAIGNYDYLVSWVFRNDGSLRSECDLTGMMLTKGVPALAETNHRRPATGHLVAPRIEAVNHQHFFSFRLDFDIDGAGNNSVMETATSPTPSDAGNAFAMTERALTSELEALRSLDLPSGRKWRIVNPGARNALGSAPGYLLVPGENAPSYAQPDNPERRRAAFVDHHLWVTRYRSDERFSAGDYPNQSDKREGLPNFVSDNAPLTSEDVVLWYTLGVTHIPRPEDWPIMPAHRTGFTLMPAGFFNRNPALKR